MAAPGAPTGLRWTRLSDRTLALNWTRAANSLSFAIQMQKGSADQPWRTMWSNLKESRFTARNFSGDRAVRFRVYASNRDGNSAYSNVTDWFYLPPPKVTNLRTEGTVLGAKISWKRTGSFYNAGVEIERHDAVRWTLGTGVSGPAPLQFTDPDGFGSPLSYRVRGFNGPIGDVIDGVQQGRVYGEWSAWQAVVGANLPPYPPLLTAPIGYALAGTITFAWEHQARGISAQTKAEIRYRLRGSSTWTTKTVTGQAQTLTQTLTAGEYEWQVRTQGEWGDFGDWAAVQVFQAITRPTAAITAPSAGTFGSSTLTATVTTSQAEALPIAGWEADLLVDGGIVEQQTGSGAPTTIQWKTLLNTHGAAVSMRVRVRVGGRVVTSHPGGGMTLEIVDAVWSTPVTRAWTLAFSPPPLPVLTGVWDEEMGCHLLTVKAGTGSPATVSLTVECLWDGEIVAADLPATLTELVDFRGKTYGETTYRAVAYTSTGAASTRDITVVADSGKLWLHTLTGEGVGMPYNPEWVREIDKTEDQLIVFDGDDKATLIVGSPRVVRRKVSVSTTLAPPASEVGAEEMRGRIESMCDSHDLTCFRAPIGPPMIGHMNGLRISEATSGLGQVSFTFEEAQ